MLGSNEAGKSTLFKKLMSEMIPTHGKAEIDQYK
jgi:ABC-type multidrug transport system ATPase subunit